MTQRYDGDTQHSDRMAYDAPRLMVLGSLGELTQGVLGGAEDFPSPGGNLDSDIL